MPHPTHSSAVDTIPGCAWRAAPDGRVEAVNSAWRAYLGEHAPQDMWQRALHPHDKRHFLDFWTALSSSRTPGEVEARMRRHDGMFRWFVVRVVPLCDATGNVIEWYGQNTDVEDQKRAETTLAGEKALLEMVAAGDALPVVLEALCGLVMSLAESCVCSVLLADRNLGVVRHAAAPGLPDALTQNIDKRPFAAPHWGPCARAVDHNEQVIVTDIASDRTWRGGDWSLMCLAEGLRACWTTPIRSRAGQPLGAFAIYQRDPGEPTALQLSLIDRFTHIASIAVERSWNEAALKRSEAQLARAQRLSATGSFSYRTDSQQLSLSEETYRLCGFDPTQPVAPETMRDRIHPDDVPLFRTMLATGDRQFDFECRLRLDSGELRHIHVVADVLRDAAGKLIEWVGVVRDVTESKAREAALHEARSALAHTARVATLGALTASITHEVTQPLSGVSTNTRLLERMVEAEAPDLTEARTAAQRARRDAERAIAVIARLRALFQKTQVTHARFDLNDALKDVSSLLAHELQSARVELQLELASKLPHVTGDRVQVQQVLVNLLLNAIEAMSAQSAPRTLVLRSQLRDSREVQVTVSDCGPGISSEVAPHLFESFYTTKAQGLGIGLSVSRSIIDSHNGRLWSEASERGAAFCFTLPCAKSDPEQAP